MEIVSYELQPVEHTTSSQHKYGVHMMSPTTVMTSYERWNDVMYPWKVNSVQKSSLSKRFVDSKNLAVGDSILLFVEKLYFR